MGEYEDQHPDAYGRDEETEEQTPRLWRFLGFGLPRQVRESAPTVVDEHHDAPPLVDVQGQSPRPPRQIERVRRPLVERTPSEICDDVAEQLNASPFIDASGIVITVDGSRVTLEGTINSLMATSMAKALATNVPGVSRVQVQLRVQAAQRG